MEGMIFMAGTKYSVTEELIRAFILLLEEKPYIDITVSDVVRKAQVSRASFYRNFSSTSDILDRIIEDVTGQIRQTVIPVISSDDERQWRDFLYRYIFYAMDHRGKLLITRSSNISVIIYRLIDIAHDLDAEQEFTDIAHKYRFSVRFSAINTVIIKWLEEGQKESVEDVVNYLMSFILKI